MGFTDILGKVGGFVGKVDNVLDKVASGVNTGVKFLTTPLNELLKPLAKKVEEKVGGLLDKLPFGLGNFVKPFVSKFIDKGLGLLSGKTLGGFSFLAKFMPTVQKLADLANTIAGVLDPVEKLFPQQQQNAANVIARRHAQLITN